MPPFTGKVKREKLLLQREKSSAKKLDFHRKKIILYFRK